VDSRLDEIRQKLSDPLEVVQALGLDGKMQRQRGGVTVLCPIRAERTPSFSVTRGPDGTLRYCCFGCGATGDVFHLVAAVSGLDIHRDFPLVVEKAGALAGVMRDVPRRNEPWLSTAVGYPPLEEVQALWAQGHSVRRTQVNPDLRDLAVPMFFSARRWWPWTVEELDLVRVLPLPEELPAWPSWWPASWASSWRLVTRAYRANGDFVSLHARAVDASTPKVRFPYGFEAKGLFLADRLGAAMLRGELQKLDALVFVEGLTDIVTCAEENLSLGKAYAFLGVTQSAMAALGEVKAQSGVEQLIATHNDAAGDRFAAQIKRHFPLAKRVRLDGRP